MNRRRAAAAALAAVGALAASNRLLAARAGDLEPSLGGDRGRFHWRGFDVEYAEGGDPEAPDLLLVHGIHAAASAREFDRVFDDLTEAYHVIAPDLPGFGRSDRPPVVYSDSLYAAFLADFARQTTTDAVCVASSLSGAYVSRVQAEEASFSRLVLLAPTGETVGDRPWLRRLVRAPLVGTALFNLLVSKPSLRLFGREWSVADPAAMTDEDVAYYWQTGHRPGARFAPASFVAGDLDVDDDLGETLAALDVPVTLIWGEAAPYPTVDAGRDLAEAADARLVVVDDAKLLPHHEHPALVLEAMGHDLPALQHH